MEAASKHWQSASSWSDRVTLLRLRLGTWWSHLVHTRLEELRSARHGSLKNRLHRLVQSVLAAEDPAESFLKSIPSTGRLHVTVHYPASVPERLVRRVLRLTAKRAALHRRYRLIFAVSCLLSAPLLAIPVPGSNLPLMYAVYRAQSHHQATEGAEALRSALSRYDALDVIQRQDVAYVVQNRRGEEGGGRRDHGDDISEGEKVRDETSRDTTTSTTNPSSQLTPRYKVVTTYPPRDAFSRVSTRVATWSREAELPRWGVALADLVAHRARQAEARSDYLRSAITQKRDEVRDEIRDRQLRWRDAWETVRTRVEAVRSAAAAAVDSVERRVDHISHDPDLKRKGEEEGELLVETLGGPGDGTSSSFSGMDTSTGGSIAWVADERLAEALVREEVRTIPLGDLAAHRIAKEFGTKGLMMHVARARRQYAGAYFYSTMGL